MSPATCVFYGCRHPVERGMSKCSHHRNRAPCSALQCHNQAYARGRCVRHGARKKCPIPGCTSYRRASGLCLGHTATHSAQAKARHLNLPPSTQPNTTPPAATEAVDAEWVLGLEPMDFKLPPSPSWNALDSVDLAIIHILLQDTVA
ncbi:hypothetical protein H310_09679 [Aphanomyces invadans]|uniref:Uncharacterized protein n=1 Tax=Aphanomyces invadans TaxID=157072 RepID=A0A024TVH5_9STRA|nr:hypothetical protein H310_09679 [Aphanomyces invadans]ETV97342.1 hypothetical protein H310_09679 [Aphanomyces invadans]|eukprot:XP_008874050.1 hypothetical protein H310_09679 [Aphanomyces invadans]